MTRYTFENATKEQAKVRLALTGPAGSGKTYTALAVGTALAQGGPIGVVDTERGSASKYAHLFPFKRLNLDRFDPAEIPHVLAAANSAGLGVVIIDSLSKFWSGAGGMLEKVDSLGRNGNNFAGWKEARPVENAMTEAILAYPGHVIVSMRSKTAYEIETNERGKKVPVKVGLKPEQRDGIEYEYDIVGDLDRDNNLTVSKTRAPELNGRVFPRPGEDFASEILGWLNEGEPSEDANTLRDRVLAGDHTRDSLLALHTDAKRRGLLGAAITDPTSGEATTLGQIIVREGAALNQKAAGDVAA